MSKQLKNMTEPELRTYCNLLAKATASVLPDGAMFMLLLFDESCIAQYVSNANRADMIKAMRETADRLESKEDIPR